MKLMGLAGVGTGKLGNNVFSVRKGEQIVRQYNPIVANPQTDAQVAARSRLKLMSQLAAVLAPSIAIPADGLKSRRNMFISENYDLSSFADGKAQVNMALIQLTKSSVSLPSLSVVRAQATGITCSLTADAHEALDRVAYIVVAKNADGSFSIFATGIASEAGNDGTFSKVLPFTNLPIVVYAYGIRANDDATLTRFDSIVADANLNIASVSTRSRDLLANVTLTATRGVVLGMNENQGSDEEGTALISVTTAGGGSVAGGGRYAIGSNATLTATANQGYRFTNWVLPDGRTQTANPLQIVVSENAQYTAVFEVGSSEED